MLTADVHFLGIGAEDHRKASLVVRQSLDANSAYGDVALHGDGLTALQFRPVSGAETSAVRSPVNTPVRIRLCMMPATQAAVPAGTAVEDWSESIQVLTEFFGGQGTINVNSWSPDSKKFAFVSYRLLP